MVGDILRLRLQCIELILNTSKYTGANVIYWTRERKETLKKILREQLQNFSE